MVYNVSHKNLMIDIGINLYKWILTVGKCYLTNLVIPLVVTTRCEGGATSVCWVEAGDSPPQQAIIHPPKSGEPRWIKHDLLNMNVTLVLISSTV